MTDYTPTTAEVATAFAEATADSIEGTWSDRTAAFGRWIVTHDRKIAAKSWDEGHDAGQVNEHEYRPSRKMSNPYRADRIEAERQNTEDGSGVEAYLSGLKRGIEIARADRIEQGGES